MPLIIKDFLITTKIRFDLTSVRMAIIQKDTRYGEKGILIHCWWKCILMQPTWKTVLRSLKKKKRKNGTTILSSYFTLGYLSEESKNTDKKTHMYPKFIAPLFTIANMWKQLKCLSTY